MESSRVQEQVPLRRRISHDEIGMIFTAPKLSLFIPHNMAEDKNFETPLKPHKKRRIQSTAIENMYSPMTIPPSPMMKKLGCGSGVVVYRLDRETISPWKGKSPWAVKKAKKIRTEAFKRLKLESEILRKLNHPNIISYRNFSLMENGDACLSMEQGGISLDTLIEKNSDDSNNFTVFETASVTMGIANALSYLHNCHKLLHGDIKSGNVLIADNFKKVKLCDFGVAIFLKDDLSEALSKDDIYTGTQPWCSKEVLEDGPISDKADVFAYGLLIWEMLALEVPHVALISGEYEFDQDTSDESEEEEQEEINEDEYVAALGTRPALPNITFEAPFLPIIGIFACCTETDYNKRPNAQQVVQAFEPTARKLNIAFE